MMCSRPAKRQRTLLKCEWEICTRLRPPDGCSAADTPHRRQKAPIKRILCALESFASYSLSVCRTAVPLAEMLHNPGQINN
ncbi:MAG: hypothetical protein IKK09_02695 [Clostridia bacterium]|nr:hypothetical protein [Clostridia bacterium]